MANIGRELGVVGLWGRARGACTLGFKKLGYSLGSFLESWTPLEILQKCVPQDVHL